MDEISFAGEGLGRELVPVEELADCAATALAMDGARILSYGTGFGYTPLREVIAAQIGIHPYRVVLTNGWLQGWQLLMRTYARGHQVVVEYPTYQRALDLLFANGCNLIYADWHDWGIDLDLLEAQVRTSQRPSFACFTPTFHNPTGRVLSLEARLKIADLMRRTNVVIVENESFAHLRYEGEALPNFFQITNGQSIWSSSFSATIAPGLRVGVYVLPNEYAGPISTVANDTYITPVLLAQATVFEFIRREQFDPNLERLREELRVRRDTLIGALQAHVDECSWTSPEGGLYVQLDLPPGVTTVDVNERAEGVTVAAGPTYGGMPHQMRLNFAEPASVQEIEAGIERLGPAIAEAIAAAPSF